MPNQQLHDVWIVVPAYNEEARLAPTLRSLADSACSVVVIDDGSTDGTYDVALAHGVWALRHPINRGAGAASQTGFDFALRHGAEVLVTFDADGQHCVADLERMIQPILNGETDIVLGSRFLGKTIDMPASRKLVLKAGVLFTRIFSRIYVTDTHNGFRAFSRKAAQRIRIRQDRFAHGSEILDQIRPQGLRFREMPVTIRYTADTLRKGQSSWNAINIVAQLLVGRVLQ